MANIINKANYEAIAGYYSNLRLQLDGATHYLFDAVDLIVKLDDFEPSLDLLQAFYDVYTTQTSVIRSNQGLISAVRALNNHVIRRGGYANLAAFYDAINPTTSATWDTISDDAGFDTGN